MFNSNISQKNVYLNISYNDFLLPNKLHDLFYSKYSCRHIVYNLLNIIQFLVVNKYI